MDWDETKTPKNTTEEPSKSERWNYAGGRSDEVVSVRLLHKYADMIDGVSLQDAAVGDRLDLSPHDASILMAEGWAVRADDEGVVRPPRAMAADSSRHPRKKR